MASAILRVALVGVIVLAPTDSRAQVPAIIKDSTAKSAPLRRSVMPENFDSTTSPCDDFYQYVNGAWVKRMPVAIAAKSYYFLRVQAEYAREAIRLLLEQVRVTASVTADATTRVVGTFYQSCLQDTTGVAQGERGDTLRLTYCRRQIDDLLQDALGELYAKAYFPPAAMVQTGAMVERIAWAAGQRLRNIPRVSAHTKEQELTVLAAMPFQVGAPGRWRDYRAMSLSPTDFQANVDSLQAMNSRAWVIRPPEPLLDSLARATLGSSVWYDKMMEAWGSRRVYVPDGSANFDMVYMSAALLQPPIFDPSADAASNYGGAGFVIAHELMHAFPRKDGPTGKGMLKGLQKWGSTDSALFAQRLQPLADQVNALGRGAVEYSADDTPEILADLAGIFVAYDAFERAMEGKPRSLLDGLTPEQRFFVAFADLFRTDRWEGQPNFYEVPAPKPYWVEGHAPNRLRVNAILPNVPEFAKAFGCKAGDPMALPADRRVVIY